MRSFMIQHLCSSVHRNSRRPITVVCLTCNQHIAYYTQKNLTDHSCPSLQHDESECEFIDNNTNDNDVLNIDSD